MPSLPIPTMINSSSPSSHSIHLATLVLHILFSVSPELKACKLHFPDSFASWLSLRFCQRLETGWQEEGYNTLFLLLVCLQQQSNCGGLQATAHTTGSGTVGGCSLLGSCWTAATWLQQQQQVSSSRLRRSRPKGSQLPDLWVTIPFSLLLLHTPPLFLLLLFLPFQHLWNKPLAFKFHSAWSI